MFFFQVFFLFFPLLRLKIPETSQEIFDQHHKQFQTLVVSKFVCFFAAVVYSCNMDVP